MLPVCYNYIQYCQSVCVHSLHYSMTDKQTCVNRFRSVLNALDDGNSTGELDFQHSTISGRISRHFFTTTTSTSNTKSFFKRNTSRSRLQTGPDTDRILRVITVNVRSVYVSCVHVFVCYAGVIWTGDTDRFERDISISIQRTVVLLSYLRVSNHFSCVSFFLVLLMRRSVWRLGDILLCF